MWIDRVGVVGGTLSCLDFHNTEVILRRQIVRQLTLECITDCHVLLGGRDLPSNEFEKNPSGLFFLA